MTITQRFQQPLELDVISAICPSQYWLVVGSFTGILTLWDLRFGLLLKSWRAGGGITSCQIHPSKGRGRWVMVSIQRSSNEDPMVEVYDIESAKLMETYEVRSTRPSSKTAAPVSSEPTEIFPSKSALIAQLVTTRPPIDPNRTPSVLGLMVGQSFASLPSGPEESGLLVSVPEANSMPSSGPGWMVTAGDDRVVRYWDLAKPSEGFVICGSQKEREVAFKLGPAAVPTMYYTLPSSHRQSTGEPRHAGIASQRQPLRPHYDAICAVGTVETPFSSCVISGDRSGVVKVWRMESGEATGGRS